MFQMRGKVFNKRFDQPPAVDIVFEPRRQAAG